MQKQLKPRARGERIECVCGATEESRGGHVSQPGELWVQCDTCDAWLHGVCVGLAKKAPKGRALSATSPVQLSSRSPAGNGCSQCSQHGALLAAMKGIGSLL